MGGMPLVVVRACRRRRWKDSVRRRWRRPWVLGGKYVGRMRCGGVGEREMRQGLSDPRINDRVGLRTTYQLGQVMEYRLGQRIEFRLGHRMEYQRGWVISARLSAHETEGWGLTGRGVVAAKEKRGWGCKGVIPWGVGARGREYDERGVGARL